MLALICTCRVTRMELVKKKKRVTFKKKNVNQSIMLLLKDQYSRVIGKDHKNALKIEQAIRSLSKYPLPLSSGEDCFILKGFDQNLCRYVNEKVFVTKLVISDEISPVPETYNYISSENKEDREIQTVEAKKITVPFSLDSDDEPCRLDVYQAQLNSVQDSVHNKLDYIDMPPGSYEVILVVDKNEPPLLAVPTKFHKVESRSLKVGDILWVARSKINGDELVLPFIVERKRIDDFAASIKDGRFHEQKFRLRKCGLRNVIYLLEDHPGKKYCGLPKATLDQAKMNTRIQDGFLIHETDSLKGTKKYLNMMTSAIVKKLEGQHLRGTNCENPGKLLMLFNNFNECSSKTKPFTVKEIFIKMLLQLKGVSVEKALAITKDFDSPKALMTAYNNLEKKDQELLLAKLSYNSYLPKVGPSISKTLSMFFNYSSFDISANNED